MPSTTNCKLIGLFERSQEYCRKRGHTVYNAGHDMPACAQNQNVVWLYDHSIYHFQSKIGNNKYALDQAQSLKWEKGPSCCAGGLYGNRIGYIHPDPGGFLDYVAITNCTNPGRRLHEVSLQAPALPCFKRSAGTLSLRM